MLFESNGKLEGAGLTSTEWLTEEHAVGLLHGAHPIIPLVKLEDYSKEVVACTKGIKHLEARFTNKAVTEAEEYCKKHSLPYQVLSED